MKTILRLSAIALFIPLISCSQVDFNKIGKDINKEINNTTTGKKPLSNEEIISGLKEALSVGSKNASAAASKLDGYYKNPVIKIPFPPEAKQMESKLRAIGMGKQVDDFVMTLNRAAEEAAKQATPVFVDAVKKMTIADGLQILKGSDTAATGYLRKTTSPKLHDDFKPVIKTATQKVDVTKYWTPLVTAYDKIPFVTKVNPDLDEYVTQRALTGLFYLVSQEETKIRKDPMARVTDILKRVFGN
jgi:hypothetical protein